MNKNDYLNRYVELIDEIKTKEIQTEICIEKFLNGESILSVDAVQNIINKNNEQIEQMKKLAKISLDNFNMMVKKEKLKEENLYSSNDKNEEIDLNKQAALSILIDGVLNKELPLKEALELKNDMIKSMYSDEVTSDFSKK